MNWTVIALMASTFAVAMLLLVRRGDRCPHCGHFKARHAPEMVDVSADYECLECNSRCSW